MQLPNARPGDALKGALLGLGKGVRSFCVSFLVGNV